MKILLFEDNQSVTDLLYDYLTRYGHDVKFSHSGINALQKYEDFNPEIVLMDIQMEGVNGIRAMKNIKASYPNAVVIALSGSFLLEDKEKLYEEGFNDTLQKPFDIEKLIEVLDKWQSKVQNY